MAKYVDNVAFNEKLTEYLILCEEAEQRGEEVPPVPNYIGEIFIKIATGLGNTHRFSRYTYLDELIGDAIEACFVKVRKYNYKKYNNPFAYFTQICWFAFIGKLGEEYKQKKIIYRVCEKLSIDDFNLDTDDVDVQNQYLEFLRENIDQREFDRIRQQENDKKFVHRMISKKTDEQDDEAQQITATALTFD